MVGLKCVTIPAEDIQRGCELRPEKNSNSSSQHQLLERFLIDNGLLRGLESRIAEFNVFEAVGMVNRELRHSDFLAFLLNPAQKHDHGDRFLKAFLIQALRSSPETVVDLLKIELANLNAAVVERESQNIDILIHDEANGIVCVIENKLLSGEHSDQLNRYLRQVSNRFPNLRLLIPIFLTPDGSSPSDSESPYIPMSYGDVAAVIDDMQQHEASRLHRDLNTFMLHYVRMLRRYVVSDSDIAELCREIYKQHKAAIDLIIEHIPDLRLSISAYLCDLIRAQPGLLLTRETKSYISFFPAAMGDAPALNLGIGWAGNTNVLQFDIANADGSLTLYLYLGPVQPGHEDVRRRLFEFAQEQPHIFIGCRPKLAPIWTYLYKFKLLTKDDYPDASLDDLIETVRPRWQRFLDTQLGPLCEAIASIQW